MSPWMHLALVGVALGPLVGCSAQDDFASLDTEELDDGASLEGLDLQIDVVPPDNFRAEADTDLLGPPGALPQTFAFVLSNDLDLVLREAITLRGTVTGYVAAPWAFDVPGAPAALANARVSMRLADTIQSANTLTDGSADGILGSFALRLPPADGYAVDVVPDSPLIAPYAAFVDLRDETPVSFELGLGASVWGRVLNADGSPLVGARVHGVDARGTATAAAVTDAGGWWLVRVQPATWSFVCEGRDNGRDPVIALRSVEVDELGVRVDFEYPSLSLGTITGRVIDASGQGVEGAIAQMQAINLDGYAGIEFSAAKGVQTDDDGVFTAVLPPGQWNVELLPPDSSGLGPVVLGPIAVARSDVADLSDVALPTKVAMVGVVADTDGIVLPGAVVSATEIGFAGRSWTAVTDIAGGFALSVPDVPLAVEILPPGDRSDLALTRLTVAEPGAELLQFGLGVGVRIAGRVLFEDEAEPVPFAVLEVRDADGTRWASGLTGPDGSFELRIPRPEP